MQTMELHPMIMHKIEQLPQPNYNKTDEKKKQKSPHVRQLALLLQPSQRRWAHGRHRSDRSDR